MFQSDTANQHQGVALHILTAVVLEFLPVHMYAYQVLYGSMV